MLHNKKAVIGETITWIVATMVIIVILIFSIFVSSILKKDKAFSKSLSLEGTDLLASKSLTAYLLTKNSSGETVFEQLKNKDDSQDMQGIFDDFNSNLAKNIFLKLYKKNYMEDRIWLGVYYDVVGNAEKRNKYFETPPVNIKGGDENWKKTQAPYVLEKINLNKEKFFVLIMTN